MAKIIMNFPTHRSAWDQEGSACRPMVVAIGGPATVWYWKKTFSFWLLKVLSLGHRLIDLLLIFLSG